MCGLSELERPLLFHSSFTVVCGTLTCCLKQGNLKQTNPTQRKTKTFLLAVVKKKKQNFPTAQVDPLLL